MTFYQELQVNQAGSKKLIRESASQREKLYHIAVYLTKIAITVAFCFIFVSLYSLGFGADNSIVGVVVLLYLLVFRSAHLCIRTGQSTLLLAGFFGIMAVGPHAANLAGPVGGLFINAAAIALLILFGCHEPRMFNQSTLAGTPIKCACLDLLSVRFWSARYSTATIAAMPMSSVQETFFLLSICAIRAPNGSFARSSAFRSCFSLQS